MSNIKKRMRPYYPRKRTKAPSIPHTQLKDLVHLLSMEMGAYLVLIEEGTPQQTDMAHLRAKSFFLKHAQEIEKLAAQLQGSFPETVKALLQSVDEILHSPSSKWVDEAKVSNYYRSLEELKAA